MANGLSDETRAAVAAAYPDILLRLAAGDLVKDILKEKGFTRQDLDRYKLSTPGAIAAWDIHREASADSIFEEAMVAARTPVDKEYAQHHRTYIDTLKWAARIRNPRLYSDKSQVDVNVRTLDLTKIISDANARLAASKEPRLINGMDNNRDASDIHTHAQPAQLALDAALRTLL